MQERSHNPQTERRGRERGVHTERRGRERERLTYTEEKQRERLTYSCVSAVRAASEREVKDKDAIARLKARCDALSSQAASLGGGGGGEAESGNGMNGSNSQGARAGGATIGAAATTTTAFGFRKSLCRSASKGGAGRVAVEEVGRGVESVREMERGHAEVVNEMEREIARLRDLLLFRDERELDVDASVNSQLRQLDGAFGMKEGQETMLGQHAYQVCEGKVGGQRRGKRAGLGRLWCLRVVRCRVGSVHFEFVKVQCIYSLVPNVHVCLMCLSVFLSPLPPSLLLSLPLPVRSECWRSKRPCSKRKSRGFTSNSRLL
jgi:hypothetical protein